MIYEVGLCGEDGKEVNYEGYKRQRVKFRKRDNHLIASNFSFPEYKGKGITVIGFLLFKPIKLPYDSGKIQLFDLMTIRCTSLDIHEEIV